MEAFEDVKTSDNSWPQRGVMEVGTGERGR